MIDVEKERDQGFHYTPWMDVNLLAGNFLPEAGACSDFPTSGKSP
jgi:hypothetical protein